MSSIRIVTTDFYMNSPIKGLDVLSSEFRGTTIYQVPVIRIFGANNLGQKVCLHVHGVFPYMYIPFESSESPNTVMYKIASELDKSINTSLGQASSNVHHIYKITLTSGIPLYGYHAREHQFLKIYFYNPLIIRKACTLLQNGNVLGKVYQPFESHIPYILQFMIDYNLHGMNEIIVSKLYHRVSSNSEELLQPTHLAKMSVCKVEADTLAEHILNKLRDDDLTLNPGIAAIWEDEKQRRRNVNKSSQISPCLSPARMNISSTATHKMFKQALKDKLVSQKNIDNTLSTVTYPRETPISSSIMNASNVENHSQNVLTNCDESFAGQSTNDVSTFDTTAENLLDVLKELGHKANIEEDSILSQVCKQEDSEEEVDMSIPMPSDNFLGSETLIKQLDCINAGMIPQLDGAESEMFIEESATLDPIANRTRSRSSLLNDHTHSGEPVENKFRKLESRSLNLNDNSIVVSSDKKIAAKCVARKSALKRKTKKHKKRNDFASDTEISDNNTINNTQFKRLYPNADWWMAEKNDISNFEAGYPKHRLLQNDLKSLHVFKEQYLNKEMALLSTYQVFLNENSLEAYENILTGNLEQKRNKIKILSNVILRNEEKFDLSNFPSNAMSATNNFNSKYSFNTCGVLIQNNVCQFTEEQSGSNLNSLLDEGLSKSLSNEKPQADSHKQNETLLKSLSNEKPQADAHKQNETLPKSLSEEKPQEDTRKQNETFAKSLSNEKSQEGAHKQNETLSQSLSHEKSQEDTHKQNEINKRRSVTRPKFSEQLLKKQKETEEKFFECLRYTVKDSAISGAFILQNLRESNKLIRSSCSRKGILKSKKSISRLKTVTFQSKLVDIKYFSTDTESSSDEDSKNYVTNAKILRRKQLCSLDGPNDSSSSDEDYIDDNNATTQPKFSIQQNVNIDNNSTVHHSSDIFTPNNVTISKTRIKRQNASFFDEVMAVIGPEKKAKTVEGKTTVLSDNVRSYDKKTNIFPVAGSSTSAYNKTNFSLELPNVEVIPKLKKDNRNVLIVPKCNPPTRKELLLNLSSYNIPLLRYQEPFYSNISDVTGKIDVGHTTLKVGTKTTNDLPEFESFMNYKLQSIRIEKLKKINQCVEISVNALKNAKFAFSANTDCTIIPIKHPPTCKEVKQWIKQQATSTKTEIRKQRKTRKILVPLSQSQNENDDCSQSISISPFSPTDYELNVKLSSQELDQTITSQDILTKAQNTEGESNTSEIDPNSGFTPLELHKFSSNTSGGKNNSCEITGATMNNVYGFKMSLENLKNIKAVTKHEYLTLLVLEVHTQTRMELKPNPEFDPIRAIFFSVFNDVPDNIKSNEKNTGIIAVNIFPDCRRDSFISGLDTTEVNLIFVDSEISLIKKFMEIIKFWDPDMFAGYEIEMLSWGYLIKRSSVLEINLLPLLSRIIQTNEKKIVENTEEDLKLPGRIVLDIWRLMRHEIALQSYTFENIVYHVLHERTPLYSFKNLTLWWDHHTNKYRHITANYYLYRVRGVVRILNQLDAIGRTCELARLFGIQFYEVLSRGSQFRVESMMLRLAKPQNYIAVSPSVEQRANMRAPESIPLILEPESRFYIDPVIVLDFQSLYPSIIIAYNYCFSTCLGRIEQLGTNLPFEFGAAHLKVPKLRVQKYFSKNLLHFSPCGAAFVKPQVRKGILPRMLEQILNTRLMVKDSMKKNKGDKTLLRVLHNRQLGLKLIANVTYGYTAAHFSGRMPCVEVGDSVVSKGRETLLRAIKLVENNADWGAKVVYGDTDSLFILVPGRSREDAFKIGAQIADAVTNDNPNPVKLKLEKVYHPCILQTKKRYVGYMYESADQKEPEFNAKGIETVRRDGCPAVSKILEKCLRILFETRDVSCIRAYAVRQFVKIFSGRISIQDLTFAKEYRGAKSYRPGACVPALELSKKWIAVDKCSEPRCKERVPYVIVNGPAGLPLIKLVRSPRELLTDSSLRPNSVYYITHAIIPAVNRCFTLIGVDFNNWFNEMPRKLYQTLPTSTHSTNKKSTISQYFSTTNCAVCNQPTSDGFCDMCKSNPQSTVVILQSKIRWWERTYSQTNVICQKCCGVTSEPSCTSLDCPVLYKIIQAKKDLQQCEFARNFISIV